MKAVSGEMVEMPRFKGNQLDQPNSPGRPRMNSSRRSFTAASTATAGAIEEREQ
jgi:hypothetical protein